MIDICIIGGGAAGLTAAITAKEANPDLKVLIVEKKNQVGKKILITGNGKCNITNVACKGYEETVRFFSGLGILTRVDKSGRVYPYTEEARAVRDALLTKARELGVEICLSSEAVSVSRQKNFLVDIGNRVLESRKVLIATGGKSAPQCGSTGDGYRFARAFGHKVNKLIPVLTAIEVKEDVKSLAGIRVKAAVALMYKAKEIFREEGEIQFTATGISGICVFNMSRFMLLPEGQKPDGGFDDYSIIIDFFPGEERLEEILRDRIRSGFGGDRMLQFMVKKPFEEMIFRMCPEKDVAQVAHILRNFPLSPMGARGWNFAQVTKGGVALDQINPETMESIYIKDLYFAGEVLDYDGPCGGYNLQNAWETGAMAGRGMADE
ncbi:MAG: aminoacetone oxidase family FAD-binding enzyme [Eubacteriaceae bacterium]|nr:aminoacetone oxidase family FAD-binding enzyme [Eubacteriaceae bacterium]